MLAGWSVVIAATPDTRSGLVLVLRAAVRGSGHRARRRRDWARPAGRLTAAAADRRRPGRDLHPVRLPRSRGVASTGPCLRTGERPGRPELSEPCRARGPGLIPMPHRRATPRHIGHHTRRMQFAGRQGRASQPVHRMTRTAISGPGGACSRYWGWRATSADTPSSASVGSTIDARPSARTHHNCDQSSS